MRTTATSLNSQSQTRQARGRVLGFTLIELLLATAIFAIVLVAVNTVFFAAMRLRRTTSEALDRSLPLNRALGILRRDLQNAVQPGGTMTGNFVYDGGGSAGSGIGAAINSGNTAASTVAANSVTAQLGGLDFFTTTGNLSANAPWGDLQEVNYRLAAPSDPTKAFGKDLVRSVNRNLLALASQTPVEQRLASNIASLEFEFWDGIQWRPYWDTTSGDTNLPLAVRVSVQMATDPAVSSVRQQPEQMVVLLDTQLVSTNSTTSTTGGS